MTSNPTIGDLQIIRSIPVFRGLTPDTVARIIAPATAVMLAPHQVLFRHVAVRAAAKLRQIAADERASVRRRLR
jgi:hypothetical protein